MKLIILAAGKGTRFIPITKTMPKGMVPLLGEPLLKHVLEPYLPYVSDIIFVVNSPLGMQVKDYFGEKYLEHKIFYKIQIEQKGTLDALFTCKDLLEKDEIFCVCNGDDLVEGRDIENAFKEETLGIGISKKTMPKNYLGIQIENGYVSGFKRHNNAKAFVEDVFYNGFNILDYKVFAFNPVATQNGELGLPQTLFANLTSYPLRAFPFQKWETVNGPLDVPNAVKFLENN